MLIHKTLLKAFVALAALLTLTIGYLCYIELDKLESSWQREVETLSFKQSSQWQAKQNQLAQELLVAVQPLLVDSVFLQSAQALQKGVFTHPLENIQQRPEYDVVDRVLNEYWHVFQTKGFSELTLHLASGSSISYLKSELPSSDQAGAGGDELAEVFKTGNTNLSIGLSRQGVVYKLLVPIPQEQTIMAVLELNSLLDVESSTAVLLHKHLVDVLVWDQVRQQLHPSIVGDWRLNAASNPVASWWQQGLIATEKPQQLLQLPEATFLLTWVDHSSRQMALLIWSEISTEHKIYQKRRYASMIQWFLIWMLISLVFYLGFKWLQKKQTHLIEQYQQLMAAEHQELEQTHARLSLALRTSNSGFWEWNIVSNRIRFSPEWRELLCLPPGENEMDVVDWLTVLDPNHRQSHHQDMMNHIKGLTPMFENEYRVKTGDGDYRWILSRGKVIERDANGRASLIIGFYADISDKKNTEIVSVRQQAALQVLNEITSLPVSDVDEQLKRALLLATKFLGVTRSGISNIRKREYRLRVSVDVQEKKSSPSVQSLGNTYCSLVVASDSCFAEDNIPKSAHLDHPAFLRDGFESYIGIPVKVSGVTYGTLFFMAPKSRGRQFDQLEIDFVALLARWASAIIDRAQRDEEKKIIIERFKKLSEHLPGFLYQYQLKPDGTSFYPYASPGIYSIYGLTAEEVSESSDKLMERIHPDDFGWAAESISYSASNLTPWVATVRVNNPLRGMLWTHIQSIPERLDDGSVLWHGYVSDITALKNTEIKLERSNAMHQAILDAASVSIITTDTSGIIKTFNRGAELMLGYSADELIDKKTPEIFHLPEEMSAKAESLSKELGIPVLPGVDLFALKAREGVDDENEWSYIRKNGEKIPVSLTVSALRNKFGKIKGFLSIARDISELKRIDKLKNEFVSTVSHELRTPLTSISGALGIVNNGLVGQLPEQAQKLISIAHNNSLRLIHLVNDLLDMEKLLAGKMNFEMKSHSIKDLVIKSIEANANYALQFDVVYRLDANAIDAIVNVDSLRLQQVMANFLSNAAKFSPANSEVMINIELYCGLLRIKVIDKGPGIPEEFRDRIFQKFSQADSSDTRRKSGTGLGLAICKEIIEKMGGNIGFKSVVGEGSEFYIDLPIMIEEENESNGLSKEKSILVVEDDQQFAEYLQSVFESRSFKVDVALNGNQAFDFLEVNRYDLVTLDLFLPDMNGIEILKDIRSREESKRESNNPLPVVIVSTNPDDGKNRLPESMRSGNGIYWIKKPMIEGEPLLTVDYAFMLQESRGRKK